MNQHNSQVVSGMSLRVSRRYASSRLAEELLEKAYGCLVPPVRRNVVPQSTSDKDSNLGGDADAAS